MLVGTDNLFVSPSKEALVIVDYAKNIGVIDGFLFHSWHTLDTRHALAEGSCWVLLSPSYIA